MAYRAKLGPSGEAGWREVWKWKDKKGVWRTRTVWGKGVAKLGTQTRQGRKRRRR